MAGPQGERISSPPSMNATAAICPTPTCAAGATPSSNAATLRRARHRRRASCRAEKLTIYGHKQARPLVDIIWPPRSASKRYSKETPAHSAGSISCRRCANIATKSTSIRRTDTHWTPEGSLLAYELLCDALNLTPNADLRHGPLTRSTRSWILEASLIRLYGRACARELDRRGGEGLRQWNCPHS